MKASVLCSLALALCLAQCVTSVTVTAASKTRFREFAKPECPPGRTCCLDGGTLEMCRFNGGVCCDNHGFCCPPGATCGKKPETGAMSCLVPKVETPEPTPAPTEAPKATPLVAERKVGKVGTMTGMNRTADRARVTPKKRGTGLVLANDNKIVHEYKNLDPEDAPSDY